MYREQKINTDFINFQEKLRSVKEEVEHLKKENIPNYVIDQIIQEIEKYQTTRYTGYLKRYYEGKIFEITEMISRLKLFVNV